MSASAIPHTAVQTESRARAFRLWVTAGPGLFWIILFLLIPSAVLLGIGFFSSNDYGSPVMPITSQPFQQVAGFSLLGWDDGNIIIFLRSLEQAGIATIVTALLAYPLVFFIMTRPESVRPLLMLFIVLPSWTNQVVRTYAWLELLGPNAPLTWVAHALHIVPPDLGIAPGGFAVTTGLAYNYLPYMIVPLYASAERLDWTLVEAGRDLYASGFKLVLAYGNAANDPGPAFGRHLRRHPRLRRLCRAAIAGWRPGLDDRIADCQPVHRNAGLALRRSAHHHHAGVHGRRAHRFSFIEPKTWRRR